MKVVVKVFGASTLALESSAQSLDLKGDATVEDALNAIHVTDEYLYVVRNGVRVTRTTKLSDGDELLMVPPIGGG